MKRPTIIAGAAVSAAVVTAAVAVATTRSSPSPDPQPTLPSIHQFAPGACRDAADAVVSLARLTRRSDVATLSAADRAELRRLQDSLVALRSAATGDVRASMEEVILSLGYLRIRLDSRTAEPEFLHQAERARSRLQKTCVDGASGQGTR
jgi:hypothetical protein